MTRLPEEPLFTVSPAPATPEPTLTHTPTLTLTLTPTVSISPAITLTPTITSTFTRTLTPTYTLPTFSASMQAFCRYGPATAYLYAWGLYPGDKAQVWGRNELGTWLWVQPAAVHYQCWVAKSVGEVVGDVMALDVAPVRLPYSTLYGPPKNVTAERKGDQVTVYWSAVHMTEDKNRGYMIEATVCQNKTLTWMAAATMNTSYTLQDETNCKKPSHAVLYTVEKHGYADPVDIPWPK